MKLKYFRTSILWVLLPVFAMAQSADVTVSGKFDATHNGDTVTVLYQSGKKFTLGSGIIKNSTVTINLVAPPPQVIHLSMGRTVPHDQRSIYVSTGNITFTTRDSLKYAVVSGGSKLTEDYDRMNKPVALISDQKFRYWSQLNAIPAGQRNGQQAKMIEARVEDLKKQESAAIYQAIDDNPNSYIALMFLINISGSVVSYDTAMPHFEKLSAELKSSPEGKALEEKILAGKSKRAGLMAADFESLTPEGKTLRLSDVMAASKYTLVDFWASWCIPCRAENPNVVKAYMAYHDKGFNVLSVSLDNKADNWKAAIAKDGMPWLHVSSLLGHSRQL
ncbi:TlpA disulfide reductase family protein [Mucilaginibacter paludis]|uniref:Alkyl hydroperoxide reductase/ Thiol specific antioxidant/ Mal allergen n=1 Tax=Mucilaginibacter paludis DSM 18603 TaxID=714943 RepID=H1YC97_9SPHI|nr:TlpA disulfide reductase family protein [Mucilaginibacter paludis]EHQ30088.1 alkyl hydroperoxide reductase/ Thiol specific antioxidant/ Mal allergen [Mucilaginibacter paludis DSM 18603]